MIQTIGFVAGIFTSVAFMPQVYKAFKTKKVNDLSWGLSILFWIGIFLWLIYGVSIHDNVLIFSNAVSLTSTSLLIVAKIKYQK